MTPDHETQQLHPAVIFDMGWLLRAQSRDQGREVTYEEADHLLQSLIAESFHEALGMLPTRPLKYGLYQLGTAAEGADLMYLLDQVRPWLGTLADLIALGSVVKLLLDKVRRRLPSRRPLVVCSSEVIEAICVHGLEESVGLPDARLSVQSQGFHELDISGQRGTPAKQPMGTEIYLVSVSTAGETYLSLADWTGKIWAQYRLSRETGEIRLLSGPSSGESRDD
jgi:hypothetical protein